MFELFPNADMFVSDPDDMADILNRKLGVPIHKNWKQIFPDHDAQAHFLRVNKSLATAPTRIEVVGTLSTPCVGDPGFAEFLQSLLRYQGVWRPMLTHSTVLAIQQSKLDILVERMMSRKTAFRMAPKSSEFPFDRIWTGSTPENPSYDPSVDGGLGVEIIPLEPLNLPAEAFDRDFVPPVVGVGEMVCITARGFLVRCIDDVLKRCSENLQWEPGSAVQHLKREGYLRASMGFAMKRSASFDLIQPVSASSDAGRYLNAWGPGNYYIRVAVNGLQAKAEDLARRGVNFTLEPESEAVQGRPIIRVDPQELCGQMFEFEEAEY